MRVFITGATGLVGRALTMRLRRDGHTVVAWSRSADRVVQRLGGEAIPASGGSADMLAAIDGCDAVVTLAGEPILPGRWTARRKASMRKSRVDLNEAVLAAITKADRPPGVILAGSAVGFYGDTKSKVVSEDDGPGEGYLAELNQDWEAVFAPAVARGIRVVWARTGIVLAPDGGALESLLPIARLGLSGPMGSGRQGVPWIHIDDHIESLMLALRSPDARGPINLVGPESVTQREFASAIGRALGRPAFVPTPSIVMMGLLGEASSVLLEGQFVQPKRLTSLGFVHRFQTLDDALQDILSTTQVTLTNLSTTPAVDHGANYLRQAPPTHELTTSRLVPSPVADVWAFFSDARNLANLSPQNAGMTMGEAPSSVTKGSRFSHRLALGPVTVPWDGEIVACTPEERFVDIQHRGPFRTWWHEHGLEKMTLPDGTSGTRLTDRVLFRSPLGPIGRAATWAYVGPQLLSLFAYRDLTLRRRFGEAHSTHTQRGTTP